MEPGQPQAKHLTLCICCEHIVGTVESDATLVVKRGPPHAVLVLSALCAEAQAASHIFRWIIEQMKEVKLAHIEIWCCKECSVHESMRLNPKFGLTFESRCREIECVIPCLCQDLGKTTCTAGEKDIHFTDEGGVSGVRPAIHLQGGKLDFFDAPVAA